MKNLLWKGWGVCAAALLVSLPLAAEGIYTTTVTGTTVNGNIYANKSDVYLTGGPTTCGHQGLPDGTYYFEVTDPSASMLLSSDGLADRTVMASNGVISSYSGSHSWVSNFPCGAIGVQLIPFANTPNMGGEYKVTLMDASCSAEDSVTHLLVGSAGCYAKTDNFKTAPDNPPGPPPQTLIGGVKFYDANHDGVFDPSEVGLAGVTIHITWTGNGGGTQDVMTQAPDGVWSLEIPQGSFTACEATPPTGWEQTYPVVPTTAASGATAYDNMAGVICWQGTAGASAIGDLNFGNVATVTGSKYYDQAQPPSAPPLATDGNGVPNANEPKIAGFRIDACFDAACPGSISATTYTDSNGDYKFYLPTATSTYLIQETPPTNFTWLQTGPIPGTVVGNAMATPAMKWSNVVVGGPQGGLYFTNLCLAGGGGMTLGFWSNRNGQRLFGADDLALMVSLNLRNADGSNFDPADYPTFRTWILGATAQNMANMLSAQLAAMELNVLNGKVNGNAIVYAPGGGYVNNLVSINQLMSDANTELGIHGTALAGDSWRSYQEALKNALDNANNNKNFVQGPAACTILPNY